MELLNIVLTILTIVANIALTFFAISAWFGLHRLERIISSMHRDITITATLTMGNHVKENFEQVNNMKETFNRFVETEHYEEAAQMQEMIEKAEKVAMESLEHFRKTFGENLAEIIVDRVKTRPED